MRAEGSSGAHRVPAGFAWERGGVTHRLALLTAFAAVPLILFGGSVTTLGAGMAVDGWLVAEGHFLPFFPIEKWFRDTATMVEHTHRLFGVLVGLLAVATLAAGIVERRPWMPLVSLLAVCGQGALGGFRVLQASPDLAFLHGALAQGVFALLCAVAVVLSPAFAETRPGSVPRSRAVARAAWSAALVVYAQIAVGAWYRHGLRGDAPASDADLRLALHLGGAFLVFLTVFAVIGRAKALAQEGSFGPSILHTYANRLALLLGVQAGLGLFAWAGRDGGGTVTALEWVTSVLHVLFGGLLLAQTLAVALHAGRSASPNGAPATVGGMA